jgi:hypothetical protein
MLDNTWVFYLSGAGAALVIYLILALLARRLRWETARTQRTPEYSNTPVSGPVGTVPAASAIQISGPLSPARDAEGRTRAEHVRWCKERARVSPSVLTSRYTPAGH